MKKNKKQVYSVKSAEGSLSSEKRRFNKVRKLVKKKVSKKLKFVKSKKTLKNKAKVLAKIKSKSESKKRSIIKKRTILQKNTIKPKKNIKKVVKKIKKEIYKKNNLKLIKKIRLKKAVKVKKISKRSKKKSKAVKIVKKSFKTVKKIESPAMESFLTNNLFKAKIKVIGIGGGGASIVSEIGKSLGKANFVIADTDSRFIKKNKGIKYFLFGQELTRGLGTGLNPELAKAAAEKEREEIEKLFENQDIVILVSSLGGGVSSGATKIFADVSKKFDCITFGIFTLPFKFEGQNKHRIALKSLTELRRMLNVSITIPNERIFKIIDDDTSITQAFSMINKNLIKSLESLIDLIYNPGIINIDFADLRAILQGKGNLAFLNTAEASGKDSSEKIMQEILNNPLYQNNNFTVEKILFNIAGGNNLSMMEVDKISRMIADQNQKAKIIFGISKSSEHKNKIKTTLLMTGTSNAKEIKRVERRPAVVDKEVKQQVVKKATANSHRVLLDFTKSGDGVVHNAVRKPKKVVKKKTNSEKKKQPFKEIENENKLVLNENIMSAFNNVGIEAEPINLSIIDVNQKKAIRRSALEIKKAEEQEAQKKSQQEKEWEIPAFLRFKK